MSTNIGFYRLRCCQGGLWCYVTVDDYIPCEVTGGQPIYSKALGDDIWVMLLEKAFAKISGGYLRSYYYYYCIHT